MEEQDTIVMQSLSDLVVTLGKVFQRYMVKNIHRTDVLQLLEMILACTDFPGYFHVEEEISYVFTHIPKSRGISGSDRNLTFRDHILAWNFHGYRGEAADLFLSCLRIIGDPIFDYFVSLAVKQVNDLFINVEAVGGAEELEATLYLLRITGEELYLKKAPHLEVLFGEMVLGRIALLGPSCSIVRSVMCKIIGYDRYPKWLNKNVAYLLPAVTFLINSIEDPRVSHAAISALDEVSESTRPKLSAVAADMVAVCGKYQTRLEAQERAVLFRAVCKNLEPLPQRSQLPLLSMLTSTIVEEARRAIGVLQGLSGAFAANVSAISEPEAVATVAREKIVMLEVIRLLKAVCDGVSAPESGGFVDEDDEDDERDERMGSAGSFSDPPSIGDGSAGQSLDVETAKGCKAFCREIWELIASTAFAFCQDEEVLEVISTFVRATLAGRPTPTFALDTSDLIPLLLRTLTLCGGSKYIIDSIAMVINTIPDPAAESGLIREDGSTDVRDLVRNVLQEVMAVTSVSIGTQQSMQDRPDVVTSYFSLLSKAVLRYPWALFTLPEEYLSKVFSQVFMGLRLQDRMSYLSVMQFLNEMSSYNPSGRATTRRRDPAARTDAEMSKKFAVDILRRISPTVIKYVLDGIGGAHTESRAWFTVALAEDGFPTVYCQPADKEAFIKGMMV
ncbi:hypothetical protein HK101_005037 [Irineochytrium annulatum]|nr:hypothetical protein HK101_005037 [Irineochytrium annulatum]